MKKTKKAAAPQKATAYRHRWGDENRRRESKCVACGLVRKITSVPSKKPRYAGHVVEVKTYTKGFRGPAVAAGAKSRCVAKSGGRRGRG